MNIHIRKKLTAALGLTLMLPTVFCLYYAGRLSDHYYVRRGESLTLSTALPVTVDPVESVAAAALTGTASSQAPLRLFGIFPIKNVEIQESEEIMLVPCGQPFGIRMLMDGIMVVGFGAVEGTDGRCPGQEAGLEIGDVIQEVNHTPLTSTDDFKEIAMGEEEVTLTVLRGETVLELTLTPAYSPIRDCWQTGLWVRDSAAGIGTLTYYEPSTGCFGGLGHPICDTDTGELIPLGSGEADPVTISGAVRGLPGKPGQLQGYFSAEDSLGELTCNSRCGVFGTLDEAPSAADAIPMAFKQEVELGEATILCTVSGDEAEEFTVEITSIDCTAATQNLTIRVTDEDLIDKTGGIVQGMSGSPIMQNGKLVGAVTHVFVSDPSQGYGIFAETMYEYSQSTAHD